MLYLHGNHIASSADTLKLAQLTKLQKLTLHGNPISEKGNYKARVVAAGRQQGGGCGCARCAMARGAACLMELPCAPPVLQMKICAHLPNLRSLDFSTITKVDRDKVTQWHRAYLKQQEARNN